MDDSKKLPVVGILGSGQLAAMMCEAYQKLGGHAYVYGETKNSPAGSVANRFFEGQPDDHAALRDFLDQVDVATLENEFYPSDDLIHLAAESGKKIYPEPEKYQLIEDKLSEKRFFESVDVAVAPYCEITDCSQLGDQPGYLKLAKGGYDGIGTYKVSNRAEAVEVFERIQGAGQILFEQQVNYTKELSLVAVSGAEDRVFYPMVETHQEDGTCRYVSFPAGVSADLEDQARDMVARILQTLNTRGVFAFELFLDSNQSLIMNESAPRPHNSGHITMDLFDASQFDNHMRAVVGLPLIQPHQRHDSAMMVNLLATKAGPFDSVQVAASLAGQDQSVNLYGKHQSRPKRKMGHINLWGKNQWQRARDIVDTLEI
jgi:5-(carboxyamino)imidazole ribonucleotide synthase